MTYTHLQQSRLQRWITLCVLLGCWPTAAQATCMQTEDGCVTCCAGSSESCHTSCPGDLPPPPPPPPVMRPPQHLEQPSPWTWRAHIDMSAGGTLIAGQTERVFLHDVATARLAIGGAYGPLEMSAVMILPNLEGADTNHTLFTYTGDLGVALDLTAQEHDGWGWNLKVIPHVGGGWALMELGPLETHTGPSFLVGGSLRWEARVDSMNPEMRLRLLTDVSQQWVWLESGPLARHINANMLHWTAGFGFVYAGI